MFKRSVTLVPNGKFRIHSWSWMVVSVLLIILELLWPNRTWKTLLIILGGTWLLAFLWTLVLGRGLSLKREMRYDWAQVGDVLQERYTLYNDSIMPALWLEVQDHSTIPDYPTGRVTAINGKEILSWQTEGICTRRGLYTLGPTSLHSGDPFGLFSVEISQSDSAVLMVLPPVLPLQAIEIAAGGWTEEGRRLRRTALETTVSVESVREYMPGDSLRLIHWPTTARRDALFVRQFDHMPSADWWIFLDLEGRIQAGSGSESTEEHGIILAASLADRGIRQGKQVGLVTHGEHLTWIPPRVSAGQLMDILRTLVVVHTGECPLRNLLAEAKHLIRHGASLIIITPNMEADWLPPLLHLIENGVTPTVLLLDPVSFGSNHTADDVCSVLADYGIHHNLITRDLLDRPEAHPGQEGRWRWRVVGPGKVIAVQRPTKSIWRRLG